MSSQSTKNIPETFPHILKTYAKDVLRTQPNDLLSWSAAYFRCIADNVEPPTKIRFEEINSPDVESVTVEYLKVLIKQIGKGYFVERHILQDKWKGLGLPEAILLQYLNICGMFHWKEVHWLKLLSVMAATLCEDLKSSLSLVCEVLTENEPGDLASIPLWVFRECYAFLARLDGSRERVIISDSSVSPNLSPSELNVEQFRQSLLGEWKKDARGSSRKNDFREIFSNITKSGSFDEIIQNLSTFDPSEDFNVVTTKPKLYAQIMQEIGAPWNWIDQFVSHYSPHLKSFNFRECLHQIGTTTHSILECEPYQCIVTEFNGIGPSVEPDKIENLLSYLQQHSTDGTIHPIQFENIDCPPLS